MSGSKTIYFSPDGAYNKLNVNTLITTEKDAEKLSAADFAPLGVFTVKLAFEFGDPHRLAKLLSDVVGVVAI